MTTKICVLAVTLLVAWGLKRQYADARADDLEWILRPTAQVVGVMTGTAFERHPGEGYLAPSRLFLIEKSCAGVNFLIAAFGMLMFTLRGRVVSVRAAAAVLAASFAASYGAAVVVNAVRIAVAMWLAAHPVGGAIADAADVHRLEGITVYFGGLALLYEAARRLDRRAAHVRCQP